MNRSHVQMPTLLTLVLFAVPGCTSSALGTTTYYAPALDQRGERVAYLKRLAYLHATTVAPIGQRLDFKEDRLFLCQMERDLTGEICIHEWPLPLEKASTSNKGEIEARVAWADSHIQYWIRLSYFGPTALGVPDPNREGTPARILTNAPSDKVFHVEPNQLGWRVVLDREPNRFAFPIDNKIIIERVERP